MSKFDTCPNCGSRDVRFVDVKNHPNIWPNVKEILGDWRSMCDACGYAWQVNSDNSITKTRDALSGEMVNALREKVGKAKK